MNNFTYKKSLGQNFLCDNNVIHNIVESAKIDKETLLIEIGPGSGAITKYMIPLCGHAILYELDDRLEKDLNELLCGYDNYSIVIGDFLKARVIDVDNSKHQLILSIKKLGKLDRKIIEVGSGFEKLNENMHLWIRDFKDRN